ncbi:Flp family type IVb pilin [Nocardioides sp. SOB44]|uniref:Flp family type IVb pilin n=1 Tax=Nocardioides cremeus TaxID=3058044 RepID=A0ABT8TQB5_9ACTN|nr:Flp family type IVb pilin [Nocardioides cremeus]MDO3396147.1 Flp family type IVb pilin [Nocardioides cremeus]
MLQFLITMINGQKAKMDERGASAVEYGLLIAGIAAAVILALTFLTPVVGAMFTETSKDITNGTK